MASTTERVRWAPPPVTRSITTRPATATTGASAAITIVRRLGPAGDRGDCRDGAARAERDHAADVGAELAGADDDAAASVATANSRGAQRGGASVKAAPRPIIQLSASTVSSSLPAPKKRAPKRGFEPTSD